MSANYEDTPLLISNYLNSRYNKDPEVIWRSSMHKIGVNKAGDTTHQDVLDQLLGNAITTPAACESSLIKV